MKKKTKFTLLLIISFLAAISIFTTIFIFILQNDPLNRTVEAVDPSATQSSYGILSSGDLLSLVFLLIFTVFFIYFIFKA